MKYLFADIGIDLPYLDGASFSGYRAEPWPVPAAEGVPANATIYFRGIKNFDGVNDIDHMLLSLSLSPEYMYYTQSHLSPAG